MAAGLLELFQLAWEAVMGSSGQLAAKKNDDLGQRHRRPAAKRRGPPHVPVMVMGAPLPSPQRVHVHAIRAKQVHWQHPSQRHAYAPHHPHAHHTPLAHAAPSASTADADWLPSMRSNNWADTLSPRQQHAGYQSHPDSSSPRCSLSSNQHHTHQQPGMQLQQPSPRGLTAEGELRSQHPPWRTGSSVPALPAHTAGGALALPSPAAAIAAGSSASSSSSLLRQQSAPVASPQLALPQAPGNTALSWRTAPFPAPLPGLALPSAAVPSDVEAAAAPASPMLPSPRAAGEGAAAAEHRSSNRGPQGLGLVGGACPTIDFEEVVLGPLVGEGGFAKVYRATWRDQEVAVKLLNPESCSRPSALEEFRREVGVLASLGPHPHVVRLVGACTQPPNLAVVTQYCSGGSLYALLHSPHVRLSWRQLVGTCLGVARGMLFLHSCGVLHRDLKSGNLLLDGEGCVKLADFGLSRAAQQAGPMTGGLGTYQWMAPEVLGHQKYSQKADVYSFSMVMWECAARQVPYSGMDGVQAALAVMNRGLRPDIPPHTPPPFAQLMRACWAALPDQRPDFAWIVPQLEAMEQEVQQQERHHRLQQQHQQQQEEEGEGPGGSGQAGAEADGVHDPENDTEAGVCHAV
ncbi:hypothetical protein N2152v2_006924 [Parachlorella kessleri]